MKALKGKLIVLIVLSSIGFKVAAQEITLKEAHQLLLQNNGFSKASVYELKAAEEENKAIKGLRLPEISISGTYVHLSDDISVDLNTQRNMLGGLLKITDPAAVLGSWNFNLLERNLGFSTANLSVPIFAGGKINAATKAGEIKYKLSENNHQMKENELTIELISMFFKLKLAKETEKLRQEVYDAVVIHNDHAMKFFTNGLIPEVETLNAKVALSNAHRELLASKKDVQLVTTAVQNLIGNDQFTSVMTNFNEPSLLQPLKDFQDEMLLENNQLKAIQENYELAKIGLKVEKSDYFPKVGAFAKYSLWKDNLSFAKTDWLVGVGVEWELFNGFQREHKIKASKFKIKQVEEIESQAKLNLMTYTLKLYNTIEKEIEQYESLKADEALAQKLKFMRTRAFEEGTGTSLEVIDATLKLAEIKLYTIKALYEYTVAYGELMVLTGKTADYINKN